jgi:hypothetical protein
MVDYPFLTFEPEPSPNPFRPKSMRFMEDDGESRSAISQHAGDRQNAEWKAAARPRHSRELQQNPVAWRDQQSSANLAQRLSPTHFRPGCFLETHGHALLAKGLGETVTEISYSVRRLVETAHQRGNPARNSIHNCGVEWRMLV